MFQALGNLWKKNNKSMISNTEHWRNWQNFIFSFLSTCFIKQLSLCLSFSWYAFIRISTLYSQQLSRLKGSRKKCYYMWYKLGILRIGVYLSTHFIYHTIHDTCICNVHLWYCDQIVHKNINFLYFFKTKGMKVFRK